MLWPVDEGNFSGGCRRHFCFLLRVSAIAAMDDSAKAAHYADKRAAGCAGVAFGCSLLISARAALHRVLLAKLSHSESPRAEEIKAKLPWSLLLNLWRVARARNIARSRLDARLGGVDGVETIFDLQTKIIAKVAGIYHA